ncbi:MAG: 4-hydroxy-tetrahydrodipicolinate reductase [Candidatus Methanomethylophilaceae archaeon]|nr:4-hydroxy-tetrahydrodipicolinate reductase [Candidatus Methanomethylophilaceae archaeon]MDD3379092.1 4-hydroxy-tetrahydrodipicolinate reductase [Candidatus Methanomethylophilaceae archaeon]MDY0224523.1 4-hydroxy-tetrahydrodipicolinate reductase [Candidatus Methanomethylophilaceae archaeon]
MINVVIGGATGKLGSLVCDIIVKSDDMRLAGTIVSENGGHIGKELYPGIIAVGPDKLNDLLKDADIYVDLTSPDAAAKILSEIPKTGTNIILGTTAVPKDIIDRMTENVKKNNTSALISANFTIGINVFWKMCEEMAKYLPDYDIEVIEAHHSAKKDAPSGTAAETVRRLQMVTGIEKTVYGREGITGPRQREIGVHSIRAGDIIGDHTVIFAKNMERLELTHKAISREALARGCIKSIRWMADKKDGKIHSMSEVLDL